LSSVSTQDLGVHGLEIETVDNQMSDTDVTGGGCEYLASP
jgi:hypothetical protein